MTFGVDTFGTGTFGDASGGGASNAVAAGGTGIGTGAGSGGDATGVNASNGVADGGTGAGSGAGSGGLGWVGVLAETIAATTGSGDYGPGLLYDESLLPGNAGKLLHATVTSLPLLGDWTFFDDGSFTVVDLPDGNYTVGYDWYANGIYGGADIASVTVGGDAIADGGTGSGSGTGSGGDAVGQINGIVDGGTGAGAGAGSGGEASGNVGGDGVAAGGIGDGVGVGSGGEAMAVTNAVAQGGTGTGTGVGSGGLAIGSVSRVLASARRESSNLQRTHRPTVH